MLFLFIFAPRDLEFWKNKSQRSFKFHFKITRVYEKSFPVSNQFYWRIALNPINQISNPKNQQIQLNTSKNEPAICPFSIILQSPA